MTHLTGRGQDSNLGSLRLRHLSGTSGSLLGICEPFLSPNVDVPILVDPTVAPFPRGGWDSGAMWGAQQENVL